MIELLRNLDPTSRYNFHSHTQYCDGRSVMEDFVVAAIEHGYAHYGFSPHSPIPIESPCNMLVESVPCYLTEVNRLRAKYGDRINLYASMEIDYLGDNWGPSHPFFKNMALDYRIGSVHFIPSLVNSDEFVDIDGSYCNFEKKMYRYFNNDIEAVVRSYYDQSLAMIEAGGFDIIGHCDKIGLNASCHCSGIDREEWYEKLVLRNLEAIMDHRYVIEVNTKAWSQHGRFFPNERYFDLLKRYNAPVLFNTDTHVPNLIEAGRKEAIACYLEATL